MINRIVSDVAPLPEENGRAIMKLQAALELLGLYDMGQERLFRLMAAILGLLLEMKYLQKSIK